MPVGHISYAYPEQSQAWDSVLHAGKMLLGQEPKVQNELIAHLYTVAGYGLSLGFPIAASVGPLPSMEDFFGEAAKMHGTMQADAFDWKTALILALKFILDYLTRLQP